MWVKAMLPRKSVQSLPMHTFRNLRLLGSLALLLAARFKRPWPIVAGILVATVFNHALAAVERRRRPEGRTTNCEGL